MANNHAEFESELEHLDEGHSSKFPNNLTGQALRDARNTLRNEYYYQQSPLLQEAITCRDAMLRRFAPNANEVLTRTLNEQIGHFNDIMTTQF